VLDVLLLLAIAGGFLEGADDQGRRSGNDGDSGLTVLNGELDSDTETLLLIGMWSVLFHHCSVPGRMHTQSPVALAISSPTFLGDRPRGPILGASADEAPTSPPVARRWLQFPCQLFELFGFEEALACGGEDEHDLDLVGIELGSWGRFLLTSFRTDLFSR